MRHQALIWSSGADVLNLFYEIIAAGNVKYRNNFDNTDNAKMTRTVSNSFR